MLLVVAGSGRFSTLDRAWPAFVSRRFQVVLSSAERPPGPRHALSSPGPLPPHSGGRRGSQGVAPARGAQLQRSYSCVYDERLACLWASLWVLRIRGPAPAIVPAVLTEDGERGSRVRVAQGTEGSNLCPSSGESRKFGHRARAGGDGQSKDGVGEKRPRLRVPVIFRARR